MKTINVLFVFTSERFKGKAVLVPKQYSAFYGQHLYPVSLQHLEQAALTRNIHKSGRGLSVLQKPDKIVLENTNFSYALGPNPNDGTLRETFVANQISNAGYALLLAEQGDFVVENHYTLEVGGKNKKQKQIKDIPNSWLVQDNIEVGYGNVIPLWLFGFLY